MTHSRESLYSLIVLLASIAYLQYVGYENAWIFSLILACFSNVFLYFHSEQARHRQNEKLKAIESIVFQMQENKRTTEIYLSEIVRILSKNEKIENKKAT